MVRVPTAEGMVDGSRETFDGKMRVRVWRVDGVEGGIPGGLPEPGSGGALDDAFCAPEGGVLLLDTSSEHAALELGGEPWEEAWEGGCDVSPLARAVLGADVPLEQLADQIPGY